MKGGNRRADPASAYQEVSPLSLMDRASRGVRDVRVEPTRVPSVVVQCPPVATVAPSVAFPTTVTPTAVTPITARAAAQVAIPGISGISGFPAVTTALGPQVTTVDIGTLNVLSQAAGIPLPQLVGTAALLGVDPAVLAISILNTRAVTGVSPFVQPGVSPFVQPGVTPTAVSPLQQLGIQPTVSPLQALGIQPTGVGGVTPTGFPAGFGQTVPGLV